MAFYYWKQYTNLDGAEKFDEFKKQLMDEINALQIEGMPKVEKYVALYSSSGRIIMCSMEVRYGLYDFERNCYKRALKHE